MKIKVGLSIGFSGANHEDVLEIDDSELEGLTEEEKDDYLHAETAEWANNYIDYWYQEIKTEVPK